MSLVFLETKRERWCLIVRSFRKVVLHIFHGFDTILEFVMSLSLTPAISSQKVSHKATGLGYESHTLNYKIKHGITRSEYGRPMYNVV